MSAFGIPKQKSDRRQPSFSTQEWSEIQTSTSKHAELLSG
jgi:hypothetical protein